MIQRNMENIIECLRKIQHSHTHTYQLIPGQKSHVCLTIRLVFRILWDWKWYCFLFQLLLLLLCRFVFGQRGFIWVFFQNIFIYFSDQDLFVVVVAATFVFVLMVSGVEIQDEDHLLVQAITNYYIWFSKNLIMKMKSLTPAPQP